MDPGGETGWSVDRFPIHVETNSLSARHGQALELSSEDSPPPVHCGKKETSGLPQAGNDVPVLYDDEPKRPVPEASFGSDTGSSAVLSGVCERDDQGPPTKSFPVNGHFVFSGSVADEFPDGGGKIPERSPDGASVEEKRDVRVEADPGNIYKHPSAQFPHVDSPISSRDRRHQCPFGASIQTQFTREAVSRSSRDDAERNVPVGEGGQDLVDRTVSAPGDNERHVSRRRIARDLASVSRTLGDEDFPA